MLPFGNTPFGGGYFGRGDWGTRQFWENVPREQRQRDTNGDLQGLLTAWGDEYDAIMGDIRAIPEQRDPWVARSSAGGEWIYATACVAEVDATYGAVIKLIEEADVGALPTGTTGADWLPYAPISRVGATWQVQVGDGVWPVVNVRTRNADATYVAGQSLGNEVWCSTGTILPFAYTGAAPAVLGVGDGTATPAVRLPIDARLVVGSVVVTVTLSFVGAIPLTDDGAGSLWNGGVAFGTVDYETGAVALNFGVIPGLLTVSGVPITATYAVRGYFLRMHQMSMLELLYKDYGILIDGDAPEWVQRAALIHYALYMGQKGSTLAYEILGSIYLFDVTAVGLWEVCTLEQILDYPAAHRFVLGTGATARYFTDLHPRRLRFDDIAADVFFYDAFGDHTGGGPGLVSIVDREVLFEDGSVPPAGDGWSLAQGFAVDVTQGYYYPGRTPATIALVTALSATDLVTYQLTFGYRVVVIMTAAQKAAFNWTGRGRFALSPYDRAGGVPPSFTADAYWIDADEGFDPLTNHWTCIVGSAVAPPIGADVAVRYWPGVDLTDCCYCRTSYIRFGVTPTAEAIAHYGSDASVGSRLDRAQARLEYRLQHVILPIHVRPFAGRVYVPPTYVELAAAAETTTAGAADIDVTVDDFLYFYRTDPVEPEDDFLYFYRTDPPMD